MERLGHNHVIINMRGEEGADFAEDVSDDAKAGTLRNMLSAAVLETVQFPDTVIRSIAVTGTNGSLEATNAAQRLSGSA
jgi:hypothetical protein